MAVDDFEDLVEEFSNQVDLPMARHGGDTYLGGVLQTSSWTATKVSTSAVFPYTPREQREDPEGHRETGEIVIYVSPGLAQGLRVRSEGTRGDVVQWRGRLWEIYQVNEWDASGSFREVMADKLDTTHTTIAAWIEDVQGGGGADS